MSSQNVSNMKSWRERTWELREKMERDGSDDSFLVICILYHFVLL